MSDVNTQFDAERTAQREAAEQAKATWDQRVADGKLVPLGNGSFRVNDPGSWDNGEVFQEINGVAMPVTNLDMSKGEAALYSRYPEWHNLGTIIPAGLSDMDAVLRAGGLDFEVRQKPVLYRAGGKVLTVPDKFVNFRDDTSAALGVVGRKYAIVQNSDGFRFLEELLGNGSMIAESAGATYGGAHVFVSTSLPEDIVIDKGGIEDTVKPYVATLNTHDGSGMFKAMVTPWRPRCGNTERFMVRDAAATWGVRHTASAMQRVEEAQRHLARSVRYFRQFEVEETTLAHSTYSADEFRSLMATLWPENEESKNVLSLLEQGYSEERFTKAAIIGAKKAATFRANREATMLELWAENSRDLGATAYAAERAVTDYLDHYSNKRLSNRSVNMSAARATAILEGSDDKLKNTAHKLLLKIS